MRYAYVADERVVSGIRQLTGWAREASAVERGGGRGVSYPGPRDKRGAPRSLTKHLFDNFSILTSNVNPFHVTC